MNIQIEKNADQYTVHVNGTTFTSSKPAYITYRFRQITGMKKSFEEIVGSASEATTELVKPRVNVNDEFCINQRFGFVESVVSMVAQGVQASAVITGEGGLGKTFTVLKTLTEAGMQDLNDADIGATGRNCFIQIKGFSTAKNLYRTLYENNDAVIVFDDCDSILKCPVSVNILKGALDSYDRRIITWGAESRGDDELPKSFEFTGRIIFISNLNQNKIDQAIRSRSMLIDLSMTLAQKIERMGTLVMQDDFMPEYENIEKLDALKFIDANKEAAREISLRSLITIAKIRATGGADWQNLAKYVLCN
jgi:hypothetical protein